MTTVSIAAQIMTNASAKAEGHEVFGWTGAGGGANWIRMPASCAIPRFDQ
jgi:hypothetical protein